MKIYLDLIIDEAGNSHTFAADFTFEQIVLIESDFVCCRILDNESNEEYHVENITFEELFKIEMQRRCDIAELEEGE